MQRVILAPPDSRRSDTASFRNPNFEFINQNSLSSRPFWLKVSIGLLQPCRLFVHHRGLARSDSLSKPEMLKPTNSQLNGKSPAAQAPAFHACSRGSLHSARVSLLEGRSRRPGQWCGRGHVKPQGGRSNLEQTLPARGRLSLDAYACARVCVLCPLYL